MPWPAAPATGADEGFLLPTPGAGTACVHRLFTGDASMSEVSAGLSTSGRREGLQVTAHVPGAECSAGLSVCIFCEWCVCALSPELDQLVRGGWDLGRGTVLALGASADVHVLVGLEMVCVCLYREAAVSAGARGGDLAISIYVLCEPCMGVLLKAEPCLQQCVRPALSASSLHADDDCGCGFIWDTCSALLLVEPAHRKAALASINQGRGLGSPGYLARLQQLGGSQSSLNIP